MTLDCDYGTSAGAAFTPLRDMGLASTSLWAAAPTQALVVRFTKATT